MNFSKHRCKCVRLYTEMNQFWTTARVKIRYYRELGRRKKTVGLWSQGYEALNLQALRQRSSHLGKDNWVWKRNTNQFSLFPEHLILSFHCCSFPLGLGRSVWRFLLRAHSRDVTECISDFSLGFLRPRLPIGIGFGIQPWNKKIGLIILIILFSMCEGDPWHIDTAAAFCLGG